MASSTLISDTQAWKELKVASLKQKINQMYNGEHSDGKKVVPDVWNVLDKIKEFSERVRSGSWVGATTGKELKNVVAICIGGSFLGPLFVHTALQTGSEVELARLLKDNNSNMIIEGIMKFLAKFNKQYVEKAVRDRQSTFGMI